ncbi:FUSC family protein [Actinosynnema pretiosum subsp. pretiosum]|uniref:FUSC family protein n=2 Tax=Actinosynnema TaxID=40566 RepID=A0AA45L3B9_9PSEU|nr:FUSC family protein [Actinosynnema mirum]ACU40709.1 putative membrane protein [Actinosynnema mirum DSM 43827]QUF02065.1 FUSC family protein [Actinosynnema pretiosum subsp. pretiosum]
MAVRDELARRLRRWRMTALPILQAAVAAGLSWFVATKVVGHPHPFFAPIAAVVCLGVSLGQRPRRVAELVVGVSVGVGIGDVLISHIGSGTWQIAVAVVLAMSAAVLLDGGAVIALQSANSAVLVATLLPPSAGGGFDRMVDALVGGVVGLAVTALIPANPLTVADRQAKVVLGELAIALRGVAAAVAKSDAGAAADVLARLRDSQEAVDEYRSALKTGGEIATIAPIRWRRKNALRRYGSIATPVDYALRNTRVLTRRALAALRDDEHVPDVLPSALERFADAVDVLRAELASNEDPVKSRAAIRAAAGVMTADLAVGEGFSTQVVLAQARSVAVDLLQATGLTRVEAMESLPPLRKP